MTTAIMVPPPAPTSAASISVALRPHQQAAFDEANHHLGEHDRVTIVMPCGTGKTLVGQRIAQHQARHGSSAILVLVPTVALLKQTLDSWVRHSRRPVAAFVFCHDTTITASDVQVPVSTRPAALAGWLARTRRASRGPSDEQVVVFATYQSSPRIADAHREHQLPPWHVVVADEAHCCAGEFEAAFATVVDDNRVPAAVRIFLTATPRVRKHAAQAAFCMDDPGAFGDFAAGRLPADRETALRALNVFSLRPGDDRFDAGMVALCKYVEDYGHARPPQNYACPDGFPLGQWVKSVRRRYQQLTPEQRAALEAQAGWVWDVRDAKWQLGLAELIAYEAAHGHLGVARDYVTASGEPLGKWFDNQKTAGRAGSLAPHRARALSERFGPDWFMPAQPQHADGAVRAKARSGLTDPAADVAGRKPRAHCTVGDRTAPTHDRPTGQRCGQNATAIAPGPVAEQQGHALVVHFGDQAREPGEGDWQEHGLCRQTDPEAFFPEKGGSTRGAKKICQRCDVRAECLSYALANDERFGVWGGLSERERRRLKHSVI